MKSAVKVNEEKKLQVTNKHKVKSTASLSQLIIAWFTWTVLHL